MESILMTADAAWLSYHATHSIRGRAVFSGSIRKKTRYGYLFCLKRGGSVPRPIVAGARIVAQTIIHQDYAWAKYGANLGADTEAEWRNRAAEVLENSRSTSAGEIVCIELDDFQTFDPGVPLADVGAADTQFQDKKELDAEVTGRLFELLLLNGDVVASDIDDAPESGRRATVVHRIIRDTQVARELKGLHKNACQICGLALLLTGGETYSEAHHLRPLGKPHNGPDVRGNIIVLCPNHHAQCDARAIPLDKAALRIMPGHTIGDEFIDYHNTSMTSATIT